MFDLAINTLCDFSDDLAERGRNKERKTVQECIRIINRIYIDHEDHRNRVQDFKARNKLESIILRLYGLHVCQRGSVVWYELLNKNIHDTKRFDTPEEVMEFLVQRWNLDLRNYEKELMHIVTEKMMEEERLTFGRDLTHQEAALVKRAIAIFKRELRNQTLPQYESVSRFRKEVTK